MTQRILPARPSLDSIRKQARKLARASPSLPLRAAQLTLARDYGFAGWDDLVAEVKRRTGRAIDAAGDEALGVIHGNDTERLRALLAAHPALVSWRDADGRTLLDEATGAFGDAGDPFREEMFTRLACAEILIDAGAGVGPSVIDHVITGRAHGLLQLLARKNALPATLEHVAALGDLDAVRRLADGPDASSRDAAAVGRALINACRFQRKDVAAFLLDRAIALDPDLGARVDAGPGRAAVIDALCQRTQVFGSPWRTFFMNEIKQAVQNGDRDGVESWLRREPAILSREAIADQVELIEAAVLNNQAAMVETLFAHDPAILNATPPPPSSAITYALEYAKPGMLPLLTRLWPVPDDLPHAAGTGNVDRVKSWFDADGRPSLGDLARHYPANTPSTRENLRWGAPCVQQVLDVALAWACLNRHLGIAEFLVQHGADVNTTWSSHEPASILHELAFHENYEAMQFLIDHGIDLTTHDYRWNATAEGWARYASKNDRMADFLAEAARARPPASP